MLLVLVAAETRRVRCGARRQFGLHVQLVELLEGERAGGGALELQQTPPERDVADLDHRRDLALRALEAVHARRDEQTRAADAAGVASDDHPVALHGRHQSQSSHRHQVRFLPELQLGCEAVDEERRVDDGDVEAEQFDELEVRGAKDVEVHAQRVRKVNEQMRRLLAAAHHVETRGHHVLRAPALDEIMGHCQLEHTEGRVHQVGRELELRSQRLYLPTSVGERHFPRLLTETRALTGQRQTPAPRGPRGVDELTHHRRSAAGGFLEVHLRYDGALREDGAAVRARRVAQRRVVLDGRAAALRALHYLILSYPISYRIYSTGHCT